MASVKRACGITLVGFLIILLLVGMPLWATFRLIPVYLEYFGVVRALESLADEPVEAWTPSQIKDLLWRRFEVNYVETVNVDDVYVEPQPGVWLVVVEYEVERPFLGNVYLLVKFHKEIELPR